jgi:uncharacterized protein (DUF362 family)
VNPPTRFRQAEHERQGRIHRRGFLRACAGAVGSLLLGARSSDGEGAPARVGAEPGPSTTPASLVVETEATGDFVARLLQPLGGIGSFVTPESLVLLKPNFSFPNPSSWATTTNPHVVAAVAKACVEAGARRVLVADHLLGQANACFTRTGATEALEPLGRAVSLISLESEVRYRRLKLPPDPVLPGTRAAREALEADCLINVPVAKSHTATVVSLGLKNLMGLVWDRVAYHRSGRIHRAIAETAWVVRPTLTILDATRILASGGPQGPGEVVELGKVLASADPVAVDAVGVGLSTWGGRTLRASDVGYIRDAEALGLGSTRVRLLKV